MYKDFQSCKISRCLLYQPLPDDKAFDPWANVHDCVLNSAFMSFAHSLLDASKHCCSWQCSLKGSHVFRFSFSGLLEGFSFSEFMGCCLAFSLDEHQFVPGGASWCHLTLSLKRAPAAGAGV